MKVHNAAELRQALDTAIERGLEQTRASFEAGGIEGEELETILASERLRLSAWRAEVEAYALHEATAPPPPAGATVTETRKPTGQLH